MRWRWVSARSASRPSPTTTPRLRSYGRHLAQECTGCHRIDGTDNGIPSIVGWDADRFARTLEFYRTGERTNPVMVSVAKSLDDEPDPRAGRLLRLAAEAGEVGWVKRSDDPTQAAISTCVASSLTLDATYAHPR